PAHVEQLLDTIDQLLDTVPGMYLQMDYSGAANASIVARKLLEQFNTEIMNTTTVANGIPLIAGILLPTLVTLVIGNLWKRKKR
ncbi:MAG: hypothetical protein ACTSSK_05930, partial [Candidatus Heimdallarchaeota archaeon]